MALTACVEEAIVTKAKPRGRPLYRSMITCTSVTSAALASSRANFTAACSFSTRSSNSRTRVAGSEPENFVVDQVPTGTSS